MTRSIGTIGRFDGVRAIATLGRFVVPQDSIPLLIRPAADVCQGDVAIALIVKV